MHTQKWSPSHISFLKKYLDYDVLVELLFNCVLFKSLLRYFTRVTNTNLWIANKLAYHFRDRIGLERVRASDGYVHFNIIVILLSYSLWWGLFTTAYLMKCEWFCNWNIDFVITHQMSVSFRNLSCRWLCRIVCLPILCLSFSEVWCQPLITWIKYYNLGHMK